MQERAVRRKVARALILGDVRVAGGTGIAAALTGAQAHRRSVAELAQPDCRATVGNDLERRLGQKSLVFRERKRAPEAMSTVAAKLRALRRAADLTQAGTCGACRCDS